MPNPIPSDSTFVLLQQLVSALEDKKAIDLCVLKVGAKSTITDYIVLATGTSEPHLRALRIEVERVLDAAKQPIAGMEVGGYGSGWVVVDAYQVMTHLFTPEQRETYALEKLWKDADILDTAKLTTKPKAAKTSTAKKTVKKVAKKIPSKASPRVSSKAKAIKPAKKRTTKKKTK